MVTMVWLLHYSESQLLTPKAVPTGSLFETLVKYDSDLRPVYH